MPITVVLSSLCAILILLLVVLWRRRASSNRELKATGAQFRSLAELSSDSLLINRNGIYVYANPSAVALLGATDQTQVIGKTPFDISHPDDHAIVREQYATILQGRSVPLKEVRVVTFDGRMLSVETMVTCYEGSDGSSVLVTMRESAARKLAEAELRGMTIALANEMPGIARVNPEGRCLEVNDMYAGMLGYDPPALIGLDWRITIHSDDQSKAQVAYESMLRAGKGEFEAVAQRKDGSTFLIQVVMTKIVGAQGCYLGHHCLMRDVSGQAQERERQRASHEWLRQAVQVSGLGIFNHYHDTDRLDWSATLRKIYGVGPDEPASLSRYLELIHPEDLDAVAAAVSKAHSPAGDGRFAIEHRIRRADGTTRWLSLCSQTLFMGVGTSRQPSRTIGAVVDITERKEAEAARREQDVRVRFLVEHVRDYAIIMLDSDGHVTTWNTGAERINGHKEEEIVGCPMETFCTSEDREVGHPAWLLAQAAAKGAVSEYGWRVRRDGGQYWASVVLTALRDDSQRLVGFAHISQDLTERKLTEDMVAQSERRFRALVETAGSAIVSFSPEGRIIGWNKAAEHISGRSRTEVMGQKFSDLCARESEREAVLADMGKALAGEPVRGAEYTASMRDGRERICSWNLDCLTNDQGKSVGLIAVGEDITMRRQAETAFIEEKQLVESIMRSLPGVLYVFDSAGRFLRWNEALETESGYGSDEITTMHPQDFVAPEDRASVREKMEEAFTTGSATLEVELLRKDGRRRPYYFTGHAVSIDGTPHLIGVGIDIFDRRHAELQLRQVNEQLLAMSTSLEQVREQEQKRIARDLHDELGHQLTAMKLDASLLVTLVQASKSSEAPKAMEAVQRLFHQLDATISSVRKIARQVRPNLLDRVGLVPALETSVSDFKERTGLTAMFICDPALEGLEQDDALNTTLYRVVQEALTNVARHSGATSVEVRLRVEDGQLTLDVEDNGKGFDQRGYAPDRSLGVRGMQERVAMIQGHFSIVGRKGQGTTVTVRTKKGIGIPC